MNDEMLRWMVGLFITVLTYVVFLTRWVVSNNGKLYGRLQDERLDRTQYVNSQMMVVNQNIEIVKGKIHELELTTTKMLSHYPTKTDIGEIFSERFLKLNERLDRISDEIKTR